jgi:hypothetical protein
MQRVEELTSYCITIQVRKFDVISKELSLSAQRLHPMMQNQDWTKLFCDSFPDVTLCEEPNPQPKKNKERPPISYLHPFCAVKTLASTRSFKIADDVRDDLVSHEFKSITELAEFLNKHKDATLCYLIRDSLIPLLSFVGYTNCETYLYICLMRTLIVLRNNKLIFDFKHSQRGLRFYIIRHLNKPREDDYGKILHTSYIKYRKQELYYELGDDDDWWEINDCLHGRTSDNTNQTLIKTYLWEKIDPLLLNAEIAEAVKAIPEEAVMEKVEVAAEIAVEAVESAEMAEASAEVAEAPAVVAEEAVKETVEVAAEIAVEAVELEEMAEAPAEVAEAPAVVAEEAVMEKVEVAAEIAVESVESEEMTKEIAEASEEYMDECEDEDEDEDKEEATKTAEATPAVDFDLRPKNELTMVKTLNDRSFCRFPSALCDEVNEVEFSVQDLQQLVHEFENRAFSYLIEDAVLPFMEIFKLSPSVPNAKELQKLIAQRLAFVLRNNNLHVWFSSDFGSVAFTHRSPGEMDTLLKSNRTLPFIIQSRHKASFIDEGETVRELLTKFDDDRFVNLVLRGIHKRPHDEDDESIDQPPQKQARKQARKQVRQPNSRKKAQSQSNRKRRSQHDKDGYDDYDEYDDYDDYDD